MTVDPIRVFSRSGSLFYHPSEHDLSSTYCALAASSPLFSGRRRRPHSVHVRSLPLEGFCWEQATAPRRHPLSTKLADSRENAKRFLKSVISLSRPSSTTSAQACTTPTRAESPAPATEQPAAMPADVRAHRSGASSSISGPLNSTHRSGASSVSGPTPGSMRRPSLTDNVRSQSGLSTGSSTSSNSLPENIEEKPVAAGNGVSVFVTLAEPVLFLQGFEQQDINNRTTAMLRGSLVVRVTKAAKLKTITLNFRGKARTEWPEGIPPKKVDYYEEEIINRHTWPFFNAQFPTAESGHCADYCKLANPGSKSDVSLPVPSSGRLTFDHFTNRASSPQPNCLSAKEQRRLSLQVTNSRSFGKGEAANGGQSVAQKGYRTFHPGDYIYNFELPLDSHLPETIDVDLGNVKYELEAMVERAGAFRANLLGSKEVTVIRTPSESSLETVEPIAISRNWEDQLHYDIVISGKSFPLGAQIPIAFKLTPLAKVQCHRIKVFVTENVEYYCANKKVHRLEPTRKVQLFEKRADAPSSSAFPGSSVRILSGGGIDYDSRVAAARGDENVRRDSTSLLGNLDGDHNIGPTEMEINVQLPNCISMKERDKFQRLHFDTTYANIQVHHWIKIVMRLSKPDTTDPSKRRHFEISIDSPFHILSCQATQANIALPAYSGRDEENAPSDLGLNECGCPGASRRQRQTSSYMHPPNPSSRSTTDGATRPTGHLPSNGIAPPPMAHIDAAHNGAVQRPIHLLRVPSFNPPAFSAEDPPPPLVTPPPQYDSIVGEGEGLADYFSRLADEAGNEEEDDRGLGRVDMPLTPGGRVNRSMDATRTWAPVSHVN